MKRVLYLLRYFPTLSETFIYEEIRALRERGIEIQIAALGKRPDGDLHENLPTVPVLRVPRRPLTGRLRVPGVGVQWLAQHQRAKDAARLPWLLRHIQEQFDHIHVHFAGEAAEWAHAIWLETQIPYSVMVHASDLFKPRPSLNTVLKDAHRVATVAEYHRKYLRDLGINAQVIRCGPDLKSWQPSPLPSGPIRALCVARDVPKKGIGDLLAAWHTAPMDAELHVVSDCKQTNLPKNVTIHGLCPATEIRRLMEQSNLFVLLCRTAPDGDLDGVPVVLMEALACGRPVITTSVSGIPELVDDQVGWLISPNTVDDFHRALNEANHHENRLRRGNNGPRRLKTRGFDLQTQADQVLALW